ncbi:MAG: aminopeptidase P family N-terminal domain-containing protein, partial [Muribaculaceae bacterium]|nr:aminopeptidase P family N-terminal domain-containing protein [Muribaculaceae bacterium]
MKTEIAKRLDALRNEMKKAGVNATIIPQADPHMSEYLASHWQARRWLSGFTGSAGDLVVTEDKAYLWTDSRYFLQAAQQLEGTEIELMKDGLPSTPSIKDFLCST